MRHSDGAVLWEKDLYTRYGGGGLGRGYASSPLIEGERLILHVGPSSSIVSLDRRTGEEIWTAGSGRSGVSSPILVELFGHKQVVNSVGQGLVGVDFESGDPLWIFPWPTKFGLNIALPVPVSENRFLIASAYDQGAALVEVSQTESGYEAISVWENRRFRNHFTAAVFYDGFLYGFDNTILKCLDAETGSERWKTRGYGKGSLVISDGKILVLSDSGDLSLLAATPESPQELATVEGVLEGKSWTSPTLAASVLYLRSHSEMVSFDLGASAGDLSTSEARDDR